MENIISPYFIYFLSLVDTIDNLMIAFCVISCIVIIVRFLCIWIEVDHDYFEVNEGENKKWKQAFKIPYKISIIVFIISLFIAVFLPSRNTIVTMYISNNITYDSIEKIVNTGEILKDELKKDVIEIIESINKKE